MINEENFHLNSGIDDAFDIPGYRITGVLIADISLSEAMLPVIRDLIEV